MVEQFYYNIGTARHNDSTLRPNPGCQKAGSETIFELMSRRIRNVGLGLAVVILLLVGSFALPVRVWRTGELAAPPLPLIAGGPSVSLPRRIWVDTDAACGQDSRTDPDDCFALLLLARARGVKIVGVSTVRGNASLQTVDRTIRELLATLGREGTPVPPVYRGAASPLADGKADGSSAASAALGRALEQGPLTLVALGPLTNVAATLRARPDLQARVGRLVAVMGRRPGHLFHPSEGAGGGVLFGHGPVFRDFNVEADRAAATEVLGMGLPMTLVPYTAAREILLTDRDLARLETRGGASAWVARRARGWLDFWKNDVGKNGFYPFDLLAAGYVLDPRRFDCANTQAWVGRDRRLWGRVGLLVGLETEKPDRVQANGEVIYCARPAADLQRWLISQLTGLGLEKS
jgi:purine nucleosidase